MRIRLIQPETVRRPMDTSLKARMAPHLGLLTVARIVEDCGHVAEVVNESLGRDEPSADVDLVGISACVDVLPRAKAIADAYERLGVPVVVGGIGVTTDTASARQMFSVLCIGPAEGHWPELLKDAKAGCLKAEYRTGPDFPGENLLPPSFRSVDTSHFLYSNVIAASRGCPFACDFCYNSAVKGVCGYRHRTVASVMEEIRSKRTRHIMFIDDNFIGDPAFARELLEAMRPLRLKWSAAVSANVDVQLLLPQVRSSDGMAMRAVLVQGHRLACTPDLILDQLMAKWYNSTIGHDCAQRQEAALRWRMSRKLNHDFVRVV